MVFTIGSFKTKIIRPGEYIFSSKEVGFLTSRTLLDSDKIHYYEIEITPDGLNFCIKCFPRGVAGATKERMEADSECIRVTFIPDGTEPESYTVKFETNANPIFKLDADGCGITYWTAVQLLQRITIEIFKIIAKMEFIPISEINKDDNN